MSNESTPQITVLLNRLLQIQTELNQGHLRLYLSVLPEDYCSKLKEEQREIQSELAGCLVWDALYLDPLLISQGYIAEVGEPENGCVPIHFRRFECTLSAAKG